jgi:hypothetical protein
MKPEETELTETVYRMEERLCAHPLFPAYERLSARFAAELTNERDVLLSSAAVLMLLQELSSGEPGSDPVTDS